jgi:tetratricopeptide (TPR) repeat protein/O-antigen ligase
MPVYMRALEQILRWIAIGATFLLPFIVIYVASPLFFPFITGKNFAFRILVEIMTAAWLGLALINANYRPRRSWILGAFAVFVLIMAVADAFGAYPFKSFWSNYERMDGWVTLIHLLAYLAVSVSVLNTEKLWRWLFWVSLTVSIGIGGRGLMQLLSLAAVGQGGVTGLSARLDATLGNAIYLAVYMLFHIFLAALLWNQQWNEKRPGKRKLISWVYGTIIVFNTIILLFTGTRGTTLGLIGGAMLAGLIYIFLEPKAKTVRAYVLASIAVLFVMGGTLYVARDTQAVKDVGFLVRLANISPYDATIQSRFMNIGMAWQGFKERPILGWGQENYALVFDKYYDPGMYNAEPWFDRVHNSIFDWLVAGGIFGLLGYLSIFAAAMWCMWIPGVFHLAERSILTGLLAGYFFHNLFVFDNVTSYLLFATILAYIAWRAAEHTKAHRVIIADMLPRAALPITAIGSIIIVGALGWYANAAALSQNTTLISALMGMSQRNDEQALTDFKNAIAYGAIGTQEAREQLIQAAARIAGSDASIDLKKRYFTLAADEMKKQSDASPLDARFPLFMGILFNSVGDYASASTALQRAHELSPAKQSILYEMAQNAQARGNAPEMLQHLKKAYEILPENITARLYYAAALIQAGKDAEADVVLAPVIATGQAADQRIGQAYAARNLYSKIIPLWEARIKAQPEDAQAFFTLAAAYYAAGNSVQAIATLQLAAQKHPGAAAQVETYISQIRSGTVPRQ